MHSEKGKKGISPVFLSTAMLPRYRENCRMLCSFRKRLKENEAMSLISEKTIQPAKKKIHKEKAFRVVRRETLRFYGASRCSP